MRAAKFSERGEVVLEATQSIHITLHLKLSLGTVTRENKIRVFQFAADHFKKNNYRNYGQVMIAFLWLGDLDFCCGAGGFTEYKLSANPRHVHAKITLPKWRNIIQSTCTCPFFLPHRR